MTESAPANLLLVQHGLIRDDGIGPNRPYHAVDLTANVIARETTQTNPRGAVMVGRAGEAGEVRLLGAAVSLGDETGKAFVADCARHTEGLRTENELKGTWCLAEHEWPQLAENTPLLNAVKAERERRIRSGEAAREAAQRHFASAPSVLNEILQNKLIPARHRIEAAKELRQVATTGPDATATAEKFVITIDLGGDNKFVCEAGIIPRSPSAEEEQW